ncbi:MULTISPECIES: exodeoxyribonuclease III [Olivibacter]|jgi:exodeoxyribonuclease-3|uniref:Exodeoxyribonuclease III Xth n=3 Tax=Sphingobacteriaceae TaxID=84566 RepID=F4CFD7_SPHS2|nr:MULTISPECIES: exodeoxyribonuclease III [Olivibacter]MCL4641727.1 exodeoxyribonuclease III [Olivibacter sp. UJ_SKK_5.1]MDM8177532.1 exodeoxyribonuclease III [Olivibacter sp. 47]MDX3912250.1 exodeoxyribonuclease III [Pseudosphingobacterium sp.]QEK99981.1 exodeoxyribonuclease III [Olivibacter sp. LS-1]
MKIITYNVNGIRAAMRKDWINWLKESDADIVCLQEIKASPDQLIDLLLIEGLGYEHYWFPAEKKGYSGTAILTKRSPKHVEYGCGIEAYDKEGRIIRADFEELSIISAYFPSGSSGDARQDFKYQFLDDFRRYSDKLLTEFPSLVISGDYNICHRAIDIHNPKSNANSSGFLPEERAWMESFINSGYIDTFRHLHPEPHQYTWWSYRANARAKNLGWRIDYNMASRALEGRIKQAAILTDALHSDHCPVFLELDC